MLEQSIVFPGRNSLSLLSLLSSRHDSKVYGMSAPLQSKKDMVRIAPFNRKIEAPIKETTTGCEDLLSGSGGVIRMVRTDPKLVPTHNVGVRVVGSRKSWCILVFMRCWSFTGSFCVGINERQTLNRFGGNVFQGTHGTRAGSRKWAVQLVYATHIHKGLLVVRRGWFRKLRNTALHMRRQAIALYNVTSYTVTDGGKKSFLRLSMATQSPI